jgi:hypothetical protein
MRRDIAYEKAMRARAKEIAPTRQPARSNRLGARRGSRAGSPKRAYFPRGVSGFWLSTRSAA